MIHLEIDSEPKYECDVWNKIPINILLLPTRQGKVAAL